MCDQTLLWIGCGGCSGETQALLGVEGQASDLLDLIDVDGLRLLWHPSLAEHDLRPVHQELIEGREHLTVLCVEGSIALAEDGMFDMAGGAGKFRIVRSLCERAGYVLAMGACACYGGWQAQPPNPSGAVGLQYTLDTPGGLLPPGWREFSKRILGVITAFTGQWPHSVPFRPGGATCPVGAEEIRRARAAVDDYAAWYAPTVLGGTLDQWAEVTTAGHLEGWPDEHPRSVIALFSRFATAAAGLHRVGHGSQNLLSGDLYRDPGSPARPLIRGGVQLDGHRHELDHALVREHTRYSWFTDAGPQHPWQMVIKPDRSRAESYSWAAAPRYGHEDRGMQLGPLPELLIAGDPLTRGRCLDQLRHHPAIVALITAEAGTAR